MTKAQKNELFWLYEDGVPFYLAKTLIGLQNVEDEYDASYTWRRWNREVEDWGFHTY